jgi:hypothetical protein
MAPLITAVFLNLIASQDFPFEEKQLVKGAPAVDLTIFVSPDGQGGALSAVSKTELRGILWTGNRQTKQYSFLRTTTFLAGGTLLFSAVAERDKNNEAVSMVVVEGETEGEPFRSVAEPVLSADRKTYAYVATMGSKEYLVVHQGKKGPVFEMIRLLTLSPDGSRVAYAVSERATDAKPGAASTRSSVVIDGARGPAWWNVSQIVFGPDGKAVAYIATSDRMQQVVQGDKPGEPYAEILDLSLSPGGVCYQASSKEGAFMVVDGKKEGPFSSIGSVHRRPDGSVVAYVAAKGKDQVVVASGQESEPYVEVRNGTVSADGTRFAYSARANFKDKPVVVLNGKPEAVRYSAVSDFVLSARGDGFAYRAIEDGRTFIVHNGVRGAELTGEGGAPVLSADGKVVAARVRDKSEWRAVLGKVRGKAYAEITDLVISPDGRSIAFKTGTSGPLVLDGKEYPAKPNPMFQWIGRPVYSPDGKKLACAAFDRSTGPSAGLWWKVFAIAR